jgi:glycosyltransferase involved in cell wall biosynthesis
VNFSIVTPSFRNSDWLRLCIASVADQQGASFEHIVQDSCSDDGTQDWLPQDRRVQAFIEKDKGMYDAVNRGYRRAQGDILAYLNCDEQYLPGALAAVSDYFAAHPRMDVVLTDTVVVGGQGEFICQRRSMIPLKHHIWVRFNALTCSIFIRRRVLEDFALYFDTHWRDLGDVFWLMELVNRGVRMGVLRRFASVFTETGENMNLKPNAQREREEKARMVPAWVNRLEPAIVGYHRLRMLAGGDYFQKPFDYSLYTKASPAERVLQHVGRPTARWPGRA